MDSAELLDLLGNANRRRILRLLARKPCYVTEISDYIGVSPKAVIDHLRKLEEAGLVESRTDDRRRKYFSISRTLRLEVSVTPYEFGTKSAYPASRGLDMASCRHLSIEIEGADATDVAEVADLAQTVKRLEELDKELSLAQRWVQGRITEIREELADAVEDGDPRLAAKLLRQLADTETDAESLAEHVDAPPAVVEDALERLASRGVVTREGRTWRLRE